jgi:hypothetical protein
MSVDRDVTPTDAQRGLLHIADALDTIVAFVETAMPIVHDLRRGLDDCGALLAPTPGSDPFALGRIEASRRRLLDALTDRRDGHDATDVSS